MYMNRHNGFLYTDARNYNEFYMVNEKFRVKGFQLIENDSLVLKIAPVPINPQWQITGQNSNYFLTNEYPSLKLVNGVNQFTLASATNNVLNFKFSVEYSVSDKSFNILNSSLPLYDGLVRSLNDWSGLPTSVSSKDVDRVKYILKNEAGITDSNSVSEKIKKLSLFLFQKLKPHEGNPAPEVKKLNPLHQYQLAESGKSEVDCANYADIYHLFANVAGISTRKIGVAGWVDYTGVSGHVFNESYIPEFNAWGMVDLTSNKAFVFSNGKRPLNTIDLFHLNLSKALDGVYALSPDSAYQKLDTVPYANVNTSEQLHFKRAAEFYVIHPDINENMSFSETFSEYLSEKSHYGVYYSGNKRKDNSKHYLKIFIYKGSLVVFFMWLLVGGIKLLGIVNLPFRIRKG